MKAILKAWRWFAGLFRTEPSLPPFKNATVTVDGETFGIEEVSVSVNQFDGECFHGAPMSHSPAEVVWYCEPYEWMVVSDYIETPE